MKVLSMTYGVAAAALVATAAASTSYDEELGCWPVSVEHDATYCIDGPICSGDGLEAAGYNCPVKGDAAIADCHSYLASYAGDDSCTLPVDATCEVISTGAWGCVLSENPTPAPTTYGSGDDDDNSLSGSGSSSGNMSVSFSVPVAAASAGGVSAGVIGAIAAAAAAVAAVAGFALYKTNQKKSAQLAQQQEHERMVEVVTP